MNVRVYSKDDCRQCAATKRRLGEKGIGFEEFDLDHDPDAVQTVKGLGYMSAPVVIVGGESWAGYRPDRIDKLAEQIGDK